MTDLERNIRLYADGVEVAKDLRIRVRGSSTMTLLPNSYYVDVYDIDEQERQSLSHKKIVYALGEDDETIIAYGELEDIYTRDSDASVISTLVLCDGRKFWNTVISESVGGGTTVRATMNHLIPSGMFSVFNAEDRRIYRGQTYQGKLPEIVSMLARSVSGRAYFLNGSVIVTSKKRTKQRYVITENELKADPETADGILILRTIVKGFSVGAVYQFEQNEYRLIAQKVDADTMNGLWQCELTFVNEALLDEYGMGGG